MSDRTTSEPGQWPIIAAADGSETSFHAVAWAAVEAELRRLPLHIVVAYGVALGRGGRARTSVGAAEMAAVRGEAERVLVEAVRVARQAAPEEALTITVAALDDLALPALIALSSRAQMLVVGSRGRGAIRRAVLGSVSTGLSRRAHCPVAVVRVPVGTDRDDSIGPIVVGVDGTENSLAATRMAFQEASQRKAPLIAVHAWGDTSGYDLPVHGWEAIHQTEDVLLGEGLAGFAEEFPDVVVERHVVCDTPVRALLDFATGAQLLVVGSHGRGGFAGLGLGSVSTAMLHSAECPVLVVRSTRRGDR